MATKLPPPDLLRKLLRYEPDTGKLFWKPRTPELFENQPKSREYEWKRWNARHAGAEALTGQTKKGYLHGTIFNVKLKAHRVIWAMMTGSDPDDQIDHINGIPHDNRWSNLRSVSNAENQRNVSRRKDNTSGTVGVTARCDRWRATINVNGQRHNLGTFMKKSDAIAARKAAEAKFGFHRNHGRR